MSVKHSKEHITIDYIQKLEKRMSSWQSSLAVVRKLMKEMDLESVSGGNKKTGDIGLKYVQNYVAKIQESLFEEE